MMWYGSYGMVWYGMVWYGMVWYGMVWYGTVRSRYGMVWYGMLYCKYVYGLYFVLIYTLFFGVSKLNKICLLKQRLQYETYVFVFLNTKRYQLPA